MRYQGDHEALDRIAARLVELEYALETRNQARAMPPSSTDDERVIDDLMAKRAAGLKATPMRQAEEWLGCDERMPGVGAPVFFLKLDSRVETGRWDGAEWTALDGAHWHPRKASHWAPRLVPPPLPRWCPK